jgi:RsiW-degrading membrane proteinase PrsW (M82 family)
MSGVETVLAAAAGGVLPALAWLWFWRREDSKHPEPRRLIALAFLGGMVAVAIVIPIQKAVEPYIPDQTLLFTAWSFIEEITKYLVALATVLWRREDDEPIDAVIYMVTVALGFAAIENTLFLLNPDLAGGTLAAVIETADLRAVGATLLHVFSSAVVGVALAVSFYKPKRVHYAYAVGGVILAALLHSAFNFFILNTPEDQVMRTFSFVWIGVIALLAALEWIKRLRPASR